MTKMDYEKILKSALQSKETPFEVASWIEEQFPELAKSESEDENIRRELIKGISKTRPNTLFLDTYITREEALAWLEKQSQVKENPISQHENKTCKENDDSLTSEDERIRKDIVFYIAANYKDDGEKARWLYWLEKQGEKEKFIKKELDCIRVYREEAIRRLQELEKQGEQKSTEWSERDKEEFQITIDTLVEAGQHDSAHWLKSLKDRVQPKQEWSDGDEEMIDSIIGNIKYLYSIGSCDNATVDMKVNWLKSLSPQSHWKPSDQELGAILAAIGDERQKGSDMAKELLKIYQQLKKLKG